MLPAAYATPAAVILLVGGLLSCFAGYRLFRVVLGLYGFILGASMATTIYGASGTLALVFAAIVGGVVGALLMVAAYFVGVGLIGAGLASLLFESAWRGMRHAEPPTVALVVVAVLGALAALSVVRFVVIFGTAIAGSWTTILGALALGEGRVAGVSKATAGVWILYPLGPVPTQWWFYVAWLGLALVGALVQMSTTSKLGGKKTAPPKKPKKD